MAQQDPLIIIVSNRGPYSFTRKDDGEFTYTRGEGGLVTALSGIMQHYDVMWVAVALSDDDKAWAESHDDQPQQIDDTLLKLVSTEKDRYDQYYNHIANPLLWFIHHQLWNVPFKPDIDQTMWEAWREGYTHINRQIAEVVAEQINQIDRPVIVFPQDYHLYLFPQFLRELVGDDVQIQPFIHIPWPGPDAWRLLPVEMRSAVVDSLLQSNRIGFQTQRDAFNFIQTARFYQDDAHTRGSRYSIEYKGRRVDAKDYPISIDVEKVHNIVQEPQTQLLKSTLLNFTTDKKIILRVDRIEPSKNILRGLQAYRSLLESYPEHRGNVHMLMLLVPSRMEVEEYQDYLKDLTAEAGMINAEYSTAFWEPVRIIMGNNYPRAIAAFQIYDALLINPIADGMNLVAKEGALINQRDGVLILSEHAGAFYELGENALIVNPFDIYNTANAMHQALTMSVAEKQERADALREQVKSADIRVWFSNQLDDALRAMSTQSKKSSTPDTPKTEKSAASMTTDGVSSESTPKPKA